MELSRPGADVAGLVARAIAARRRRERASLARLAMTAVAAWLLVIAANHAVLAGRGSAGRPPVGQRIASQGSAQALAYGALGMIGRASLADDLVGDDLSGPPQSDRPAPQGRRSSPADPRQGMSSPGPRCRIWQSGGDEAYV